VQPRIHCRRCGSDTRHHSNWDQGTGPASAAVGSLASYSGGDRTVAAVAAAGGRVPGLESHPLALEAAAEVDAAVAIALALLSCDPLVALAQRQQEPDDDTYHSVVSALLLARERERGLDWCCS
jgi:hypothetical protein